MQTQFNDLIFAYDMSTLYSSAGVRYLKDFGPYGFDFQFPGGAADPSVQLDGSLSFDGGDYLALPAGRLAQFYAQMPTAQYTVLVRLLRTGAVSGDVFACEVNAGGLWYGIIIESDNTGIMVNYHLQGAAGAPSCRVPLLGTSNRTLVGSYSVETTPRALVDQSTQTPTWAGGAYGAVAYNLATVPRIGDRASGGGKITGKLYYLALVRGAVASRDLSELSRLLSEGTKPFCWRQT